jgi:hypothetical protein
MCNMLDRPGSFLHLRMSVVPEESDLRPLVSFINHFQHFIYLRF